MSNCLAVKQQRIQLFEEKERPTEMDGLYKQLQLSLGTSGSGDGLADLSATVGHVTQTAESKDHHRPGGWFPAPLDGDRAL